MEEAGELEVDERTRKKRHTYPSPHALLRFV
jgi:hypothetical protein